MLGLTGRSVELTLPMVLSSAAEDFALDNRQLGLFAMAEVLGVTLASASSYWWLRHTRPLHLALLGIVAFVAGNWLTPYVTITWLVPMRFLTALLGEGPLLIVATALLGGAVQASRVYAFYMASQMVMGGLLLSLQGQLASRLGITGVMYSFVVLGGLTLITLPFIARSDFLAPPAADSDSGTAGSSALLLLAGMALFHAGIGGAWAFLQQRGGQQGLDFSSGGWVMGAIMTSGLIGTVMAVLGGPRLGYRLPFWCGSFALALGGVLAGQVDGMTAFFLGGMLLMVGWNLVVPYQIAALGRCGPVPAQLALVPACQGAGLAAGPMLVGWLAQGEDYSIIAILSIASAILALLCSLGGLRAQGPQQDIET